LVLRSAGAKIPQGRNRIGAGHLPKIADVSGSSMLAFLDAGDGGTIEPA
jgi:hypothetical protein